MPHPIINSIVLKNLISLRRLYQSLNIYISLGPYSKTLTLKTKDIIELNNIIMPNNCKEFERLITLYSIYPPLTLCGLHKPTLIGALTHLSLTQSYAQIILAQMMNDCGEQLNDSIRQLNEQDLQQKPLRNALINCRNSIDANRILFPQSYSQSNLFHKAIKWVF